MEIGSSQSFVIARGFRQVGEHWMLIGHDGSLRWFAQLTADPDSQAVRPVEAYRALLSSMQPGWMLRWLQIFWPDSIPRTEFFEQVQTWCEPGGEGEGQALRESQPVLERDSLPWNIAVQGPGALRESQALREGRELLRQGLLLLLQEAPLPFMRRTILEFVSPGQEGEFLRQTSDLAWWDALPGLLASYGVRVEPLSPNEIQELARWIFDPQLELE